jgi:hypothetical protein
MDMDAVDVILHEVFLHRSRWEYVKIPLFGLEFGQVVGATPLLRHLRIDDFRPEDIPISPLLCEAPQLRTVTLTNFSYPAGFLPWSQLTSLTLAPTTLPECWSILEQARALVHCELVFGGGDNDLRPDVKFLHLESVALWHVHPHHPPIDFLSGFIAPALHSLQIPIQFLGEHPIASLRSFFSKAGCKPQHVSISGYGDVLQEEYRAWFPSIPIFSFDTPGNHWSRKLFPGGVFRPAPAILNLNWTPNNLRAQFSSCLLCLTYSLSLLKARVAVDVEYFRGVNNSKYPHFL